MACAAAFDPSGTGGNWAQPMYIVDGPANVQRGSNVDVNGDGLPDIIVQYWDNGGGSEPRFFGATYLNTGSGYCVASETSHARADRLALGDPSTPSCTKEEQDSQVASVLDTRVGAILDALNLTHYAAHFANHEVDYETLLGLTDADLKEVGVKALGARKRILITARHGRYGTPVVNNHTPS